MPKVLIMSAITARLYELNLKELQELLKSLDKPREPLR